METPLEKLYSVQDLVDLLAVSDQKIYDLIKEDKLTYTHKIGKKRLFAESEVKRYYESIRVKI
ncbi:helix-turn-helix domain-containing protein [Bacteroidales bacterium OttesenSCG-928-A17]|nr:helix-turn-helix domain-containing protein [Bacteroidales bacterium OttesenSCG-928-A17]